MTRTTDRTGRGIHAGDVVAGLSVALVLIPQALAYAELAGLPAVLGLVAASLPPIAGAFLASSPYLQTGPTALTSLLVFGVLSAQLPVGDPAYVAAAALLALLVGVARVALGLLRLGAIAYFMSRPVLQGFTSAAGVLILASQVPPALGVAAPEAGVWRGVRYVAAHPGEWYAPALLLALGTVALILGARRLSPLVPGVLLAVGLGIGAGLLFPYEAPVVGAVEASLPRPTLALPWGLLPQLALGAAVIALIGFAEPAAIARTYARESRGRWNPDRELLSQGAANLTAGLFGGFPVGGSFSRSALNQASGATTRWSGLLTGAAVLAFLPLAGVLAPLPKAVLAGIVIAAVLGLLQPVRLLRLWRYARLQALTAYAAFGLTLLLAPRIDYAVVIGIGLAVAAHLYREMQLGIAARRDGDTLVLAVSGVLWFGSAHRLEARFGELLAAEPGVRRVEIDASALGRVDLSGALLLDDLAENARARGVELEVRGLKPHMRRVLERVQRSSP